MTDGTPGAKGQGRNVTEHAVDELALVDALAADLGVASPPVGRVRRVEVDVAGHGLSGLRWGADRPRLVLLHGGSLNAHAWDAMLLVHGGLDALALDLPGHGHSDWFDDPLYLPEHLAGVVAPAIQTLAAAPVVLAGHSLGGLTALALAARRPDLVAGLVLVDATPGSTPDRAQELVDFVSVRDFATFEELLDHVVAFKPHRDRASLRRSVLLNARPEPSGGWTWRHDSRDRPEVDRWRRIYEEMPRGWDHAAEVRCPVLVVRGDRSEILLPSDVARYRELVADLRVVEIAGAGHNIHGDQPVALGEAIAGFAATLGAHR
jgi:pimeloyl-ACP methyl ester carboxylesterase